MPCCNASCARLRSSCTKTSPSVCNVTWRSHAKTTWIESMRHMKISLASQAKTTTGKNLNIVSFLDSWKIFFFEILAWDESSIFHYERVRYVSALFARSIHLSSFIRCTHKRGVPNMRMSIALSSFALSVSGFGLWAKQKTVTFGPKVKSISLARKNF